MTATITMRDRCQTRRARARQRQIRWEMPWTAPSYLWLVGQGIVAATTAGVIAGGLTVAVTATASTGSPVGLLGGALGAQVGGILGFLGALVVAPTVALVLRRTRARSIRIALRQARVTAVLATFAAYQVLLPVIAQGRPAALHGIWVIGVAIACVTAWFAARALVVVSARAAIRASTP